MNNKVFFPEQPIVPIGSGSKNPARVKTPDSGSDFKQILDSQLKSTVKISNHARERLRSRGIDLSDEDLDRLSQAVGKARDKGSRDSLVLMKDMAFVVSVKNNTVITAVDSENLKENVFTNIDSAVIV